MQPKLPMDLKSMMMVAVAGLLIGILLTRVVNYLRRRHAVFRHLCGAVGVLQFHLAHETIAPNPKSHYPSFQKTSKIYYFSWTVNGPNLSKGSSGNTADSGSDRIYADADIKIQIRVFPAEKRIHLSEWYNELSDHDRRFKLFGTYALARALRQIQQDYRIVKFNNSNKYDTAANTANTANTANAGKWKIELFACGRRGDFSLTKLFKFYNALGFIYRNCKTHHVYNCGCKSTDARAKVAQLEKYIGQAQPIDLAGNFLKVFERVNSQAQRCRFFPQFGFNFPDQIQLR